MVSIDTNVKQSAMLPVIQARNFAAAVTTGAARTVLFDGLADDGLDALAECAAAGDGAAVLKCRCI